MTEEHPFLVRFLGWTPAKPLRAGDVLLGADGSLAVVANAHEAHPADVTVYNLEVERAHTYFVLAEAADDAAAVWVHNANYSARRPGGYQTRDADIHGRLSPGPNRAPGHTNTRADGYVQSHHFIQDEWAALNVARYDSQAAPARLLQSAAGQAHAIINGLQRRRRNASGWGGSLRGEFDAAYRDMLDAGVDTELARRSARQAYKYFSSIGAL